MSALLASTAHRLPRPKAAQHCLSGTRRKDNNETHLSKRYYRKETNFLRFSYVSQVLTM